MYAAHYCSRLQTALFMYRLPVPTYRTYMHFLETCTVLQDHPGDMPFTPKHRETFTLKDYRVDVNYTPRLPREQVLYSKTIPGSRTVSPRPSWGGGIAHEPSVTHVLCHLANLREIYCKVLPDPPGNVYSVKSFGEFALLNGHYT
jgi:hypothetical protein